MFWVCGWADRNFVPHFCRFFIVDGRNVVFYFWYWFNFRIALVFISTLFGIEIIDLTK